MKKIILCLILFSGVSYADEYDDYWEKIRNMKYEDQVVEIEGKTYKENSLYQEGFDLYSEESPKKEKKKKKNEDKVEYMSEGSLIPKDYKGLFED